MKKILIFFSLLTLMGGCNNNRQMQEDVDSNTTLESKKAPIQVEEPTQMEKGYDGREVGGGGGNR